MIIVFGHNEILLECGCRLRLLRWPRLRLRRYSGDLRRHYEEMKDRDLVRNITSHVSSDLQSEYRRVLPSILRRPQHRNKVGIVMNPESLTVQQRETANKVQVAEWKARADAFVTEVRGWREDKYMRERREEEGGTGSKASISVAEPAAL